MYTFTRISCYSFKVAATKIPVHELLLAGNAHGGTSGIDVVGVVAPVVWVCEDLLLESRQCDSLMLVLSPALVSEGVRSSGTV